MPESISDAPAADAAEAEATGATTVEVDWSGVSLAIPATVDDLDLDALEAFEGGKIILFLRLAIGSDAYDTAKIEFAVLNDRKPQARDLKPLGEAIAKVYGFQSAGE